MAVDGLIDLIARASESSGVVHVVKTYLVLLPFTGIVSGFLLVFACTAYALGSSQRRVTSMGVSRHTGQLILMTIMFCISTANLILSTHSIVKIFADPTSVTNASRLVISLLSFCLSQEVLAEGLLLYRAFVVQKSWLMILPSLLIWLRNIGAGMRIVQLQVAKKGAPFVWDALTYRWTLVYITVRASFAALNLRELNINLLALSCSKFALYLILLRIVRVAKPLGSLHRYKHVLVIIVESRLVSSVVVQVLLVNRVGFNRTSVVGTRTRPHSLRGGRALSGIAFAPASTVLDDLGSMEAKGTTD